jgi:hypothetical protein
MLADEIVEGFQEATAPEEALAPDLSAGLEAQYFAEGGEVPDTVVLDLPPDSDDALPDMAEPHPPRQLLPAWIKKLVN